MEQVDQYRNLTILNVDTKPIEVVYDGDSYGFIQPGEAKRLPKAMADLVVKHLIDQILNRMDIRTNSQADRDRLAAEIVIDSDDSLKVVSKSSKEILDEQIGELNTPSDLDRLIKKKEEKAQADLENFVPKEPEPEVVVEEVENKDEFVGLKTDVIPLSEASKQDLMDYTVNVLKLTMDPKTKARFLKMTKKEMAKEIDYPQEGE